MDDKALIAALLERSEDAVGSIREKYGAYCRYIAGQILADPADVEEVENDVLLKLWRTVPPARPGSLRSYLGMLSRQLAIDKRRKDPKRKLTEAYEQSLEELEDVLPDGSENAIADELALRDALSRFVKQLKEKDRRVFLLRYWYACSVREIAAELHASEGSIKMRLERTRNKLFHFLQEEDLWHE
ncbi:MAG: sigma-70 family RNA polymerase sigma factor [Lachnospiraceae bacterium]|nr:sigma-70 family RNA polymerase sigma factor [Lachnospiraceae bacterium]